jgi:hypothetical protein
MNRQVAYFELLKIKPELRFWDVQRHSQFCELQLLRLKTGTQYHSVPRGPWHIELRVLKQSSEVYARPRQIAPR